MILIILAVLLLILVYTDLKEYKIPNLIVLPAIVIGCALTGFWLQTLISFFTIFLLCEYSQIIRWTGGDIKLFAMIAAFIGWLFIPIFFVTYFFTKVYWFFMSYRMGFPLAPFAAFSTFIVLLSTATLKSIVF